MSGNEPCTEYIDVGPFRFECGGHLAGARERAIRYHGGKIAHHALSPQDVGDVDVTFWTWAQPEDDYELRLCDERHPARLDEGGVT